MNSGTGRTWLLTALALGGVVFSGYLSGVKFFSETCAFNESCPYFLGYPACYFGFALFLVVAGALLALHAGFLGRSRALQVVLYTSALGVLFSGYFTLKEAPLILSEGFAAYLLGLPTCAYGFFAFVAVFAIALAARRNPGLPVE